MKQLMKRGAWYLLALLIATDLAFIALGIVYECGFISLLDACNSLNLDSYFSLTRDRGYAEVFQYIKEFWLIILFGLLSVSRSINYLAWFFLSIFLLLDDALEIHERMGEVIADQFNFISLLNLRPVDFGELLFVGLVGIVFFIWLSFSFKISRSQERNNFKYLIGILLGLAFFGILLDLVHVIVGRNDFLKSALAVIEDGGEHIFISFMVVCAWAVINSYYLYEQGYLKQDTRK